MASSVREIARRVGVSPATVSRAINNGSQVAPELRRKVLAAMNRARYVPKVGLRATTYIAFAYAGESSLGSPFDAALVQSISERMAEHGFDLVILHVGRAKLAHETYTQMFLRKGVRGAILRTSSSTRHVCKAIADEGFPSVVVGDRFDSRTASFVYSDSRQSSREAVEHLIALGHGRVALSVNNVDDSDHLDRLEGYRAALEAGGIAFDERLVFQAPGWRGGGVQLIRRLHGLAAQRPTAVYIADPMTAAGAIGEAQELGMRVPQDLSIVGFDDADLRFLARPQMTAVCQDAAAIGREASKVLHEMIEQPERRGRARGAGIRVALPTTFELHRSTAPPPSNAVERPVAPPKSPRRVRSNP